MKRITIRHVRLLATLLAAGASATFASAQSLWHSIDGDQSTDFLGIAVAGLDDIDGDGAAEWIVGARQGTAGFPAHGPGFVRVISGSTGLVLYELQGSDVGDFFGTSVAALGDLDGDGIGEFIVGASRDKRLGVEVGSATVFSGATGSFLSIAWGDDLDDHFGIGVANLGDVDADGFSDYAVGASGDDNNGLSSGSARVFSGATGAVLYTLLGPSPGVHLGVDIAGAGDVNADGHDDIIAGMIHDTTNGPQAGAATVYSGLDGSVIYTMFGDAAFDLFGQSVAGLADIDGDGNDDFLISSSSDDDGGLDTGRVRLYSGATGAVIYTVDGYIPSEYFGASLSAGVDVTGDGIADFVAGGTVREVARVISGADGSIWYELKGPSGNGQFGRFSALSKDQNGDGIGEVIVTEWNAAPNGASSGSAHVFLGGDLLGSSYCVASPNSTGQAAEIFVQGSTSLSTGNIYLRAAPVPNEFSIFFYGSATTQVPLGNGMLCVTGTSARLPVVQAAGNVLLFQMGLSAPPSAATQITAGSTWSFQAWYRDANAGGSGFNLSNGRTVTFLP